jgi:hypothetical protein
MIHFDNSVIYYGLVFDKKKYVYGYCDIISNLIMIHFDNSVIYYGLVFDKNIHIHIFFYTTSGTPEEKVSRHVTLVGTTNVFSL